MSPGTCSPTGHPNQPKTVDSPKGVYGVGLMAQAKPKSNAITCVVA